MFIFGQIKAQFNLSTYLLTPQTASNGKDVSFLGYNFYVTHNRSLSSTSVTLGYNKT